MSACAWPVPIGRARQAGRSSRRSDRRSRRPRATGGDRGPEPVDRRIDRSRVRRPWDTSRGIASRSVRQRRRLVHRGQVAPNASPAVAAPGRAAAADRGAGDSEGDATSAGDAESGVDDLRGPRWRDRHGRLGRHRRSGRGGGIARRTGHGAGCATTTKRGALSAGAVDVWRVSCSAIVGWRYSVASQGTAGRTWSTTYERVEPSTRVRSTRSPMMAPHSERNSPGRAWA